MLFVSGEFGPASVGERAQEDLVSGQWKELQVLRRILGEFGVCLRERGGPWHQGQLVVEQQVAGYREGFFH